MFDGGDIEVENLVFIDIFFKDVVKEVGNVKLFNKWDYDVEVCDIFFMYVVFFFEKGFKWFCGFFEKLRLCDKRILLLMNWCE